MSPDSEDFSKDPNRFKFTSYRPSNGYRPFKILQRVFMVLVVVVLAVLVGRQIHHHYFATTPAAPVVQPAQNKVPAAPAVTKTSQQPTTLPNNGPGDIALLFVGVSLAVTAGHYLVTSRRSA